MATNSSQPTLAYILKGYPRISETFISNEILLLEKLGFKLHLFPMRQPRETFTHASVQEIQAKVDYLPSELLLSLRQLLIPNLFLAVKRPKNFVNAILTASSEMSLSSGSNLATLKHLLQAGYLTNNHLIKDPSVRHLHGHFAHSPTSVTRFASILSGVPFSFTAHAKDIYTSKREKLYQKIKQASFVVTCTEHNKTYLQDIARDATTPIYCIYHGIDLELFNDNQLSTNSEAPYKLLTVARMTAKKGLPTIYQALAGLRDRGVKFSHTLIGDGDDKEKIVALVEDLNLQTCCQFLGTQTHEEVLKCFKESDLFILGCQIAKNGDRDGIPNVLVESLAMRVPALSTNVSAIPEILIDGVTGLTVPPADPKAMEQAIMNLLNDQPLRVQLAENGYKYVEQKFNNRHWIKQLAKLFPKHNQHFR